jgi:hypothetical protein
VGREADGEDHRQAARDGLEDIERCSRIGEEIGAKFDRVWPGI